MSRGFQLSYIGETWQKLPNSFFVASIFMFFGWFGYLEVAIFAIALTTFIGNGVLKLACLSAFLFRKGTVRPAVKSHQKLERVSIMVPPFKESHIVERLIKRLIELDYPK